MGLTNHDPEIGHMLYLCSLHTTGIFFFLQTALLPYNIGVFHLRGVVPPCLFIVPPGEQAMSKICIPLLGLHGLLGK